MEQLEEVLNILRKLKIKHQGPLPLSKVFRALIDGKVCDSNKSVSEVLKKLQSIGKIRPVQAGVNIELLEKVKVRYSQSSLMPMKK
jgi:hypothetical protein